MPQQRGGRVPQFGKWEDGPNTAYTMIFESARKDKNGEPKLVNPYDPEALAMATAAAAKDRPPVPAPAPARAPRFIFNPNDPEQNPQAFRAGAAAFAQEDRRIKQEHPYKTPPRDVAMAAANRQQPARGGAAEYGMEQQPHRSSRNSNSARSNNDASNIQQRQGTASRRPPEPAAGAAYALTTPSPLPPHGTPGRRAAVPKFGGWDETDPATAAGYTMMFNKVKDDRYRAHAFPAPLVSDEPETYHARPSGYKPRESFWTKLFCCSSPSVH